MGKILIVDDEKKMRHILELMLEAEGYGTAQAENGKEALSLMERERFSMVITDLKMAHMDGMDLLREIKKLDPDYPVVVLTAYGSIESAVEAIKAGAIDYIAKPFEEERILLTIHRALKFSRLVEEKRILREELEKQFDFSGIVAHSRQMLEVLHEAAKVAKSPQTTVLIVGESGTGKELIARAIHYNSQRRDKKFIALNCAAIPSHLVESELFGHERGAFTGADRRKIGRFELAHGGTIFLDEIGDLSLEAQAKVLRILQEKEFERVGGTETIKADVRVIQATNQNLEELVEQGKFRQDLYYRMKVFPLYLAPLRERKEDIISLAKHFVEKFSRSMGKPVDGLTQRAEALLLEQGWPGNVRELENAVERAMILSHEGEIDVDHLRFLSSGAKEASELEREAEAPVTSQGIDLIEWERRLIHRALELAKNNQSQAARLLGLTRGKLRSRLKHLKEEKESNG
jgi:DNA-binding NtrC family response regulator